MLNIIETPGEEDEETFRPLPVVETALVASAGFETAPISSETKQTLETPQTSTNTDTVTSKFIVEAVKEASMVVDGTVF